MFKCQLHAEFYKLALGSAVGLTTLRLPTPAFAEGLSLKTPLRHGAGQPGGNREGTTPAGSVSSVEDFEYQIKYQRAFEAVLWNMPAVAIYSFRRAAFDNLGLKDNDIIAYAKPATPHLEAITANSTTPYITAFTDLQHGPTVLEVPAAGLDGSLYGQDCRCLAIHHRGCGPGRARPRQGRQVFADAPGYSEPIPPAICMFLPELSRGVCLSLCASARQVDERCLTTPSACACTLSEASNPPTQRFVDPGNKRYPTLPYYDERHFDDLHAVASVEPVREQDKVMMGMLTSLGIGRGTSFNPDENPQGDAPGGHRCLVLHAALV
jgi:hypothetical protein